MGREVPRDIIEQMRRNGFWFVDIPRTSSTSIKVKLGERFGPLYGKTNVMEREYANSESSFFEDHQTAQQMRTGLPEGLWEKLFTFTIVRNPWDRMVSLYLYRQKKGGLSLDVMFEDYIRQLKKPCPGVPGSTHSYYGFYYSNSQYVLDDKDNIIVDFIGRYEERDVAIKTISEHLDCHDLGSVNIQRVKPFGVHYSIFYNSLTQRIVEDVFAKDIELFGYVFEEF